MGHWERAYQAFLGGFLVFAGLNNITKGELIITASIITESMETF